MLVQTFSPDHPAIQAAVRHDYAAFAAGELPMREMLRYPPFTSMIRLVIRGACEPVAAEFAKYIAQRTGAAIDRRQVDARVLGPAPCPFARLRGKHRFQIQVQGPDGDSLRAAVREATSGLEAARRRAMDRRRRPGRYALSGRRAPRAVTSHGTRTVAATAEISANL